jgi:hypothetical protein
MIDCSMVQTVEGDHVRLEMPAEEAKSRFQESDGRGLFGRDDDRGEGGERTDLERSFSGTYKS